MKQTKACRGSQFVIVLALVLSGCGNKGPLIPPEPVADVVNSQEGAADEVKTEQVKTEQVETKK